MRLAQVNDGILDCLLRANFLNVIILQELVHFFHEPRKYILVENLVNVVHHHTLVKQSLVTMTLEGTHVDLRHVSCNELSMGSDSLLFPGSLLGLSPFNFLLAS